MKIKLERDEYCKLIEGALTNQMQGGNWRVNTPTYLLPAEIELVDATPEWLAEKEAEKIRIEKYRQEYEAEVAAKVKAMRDEGRSNALTEQDGPF